MSKFVLKNIGALPYDNDRGYLVRFRIRSQDRNRTSAWSPFYTVFIPANLQVNDPIDAPDDLAIYHTSLGGQSRLVSVLWTDTTPTLVGLNSLDVYTRQDSLDWKYIGRIAINRGSNLVQQIFDKDLGTVITFSFHRPLKVPVTSGLPSNTRLFQAQTTIS